MDSLVKTKNVFHRSLSSACITVICLKNCGLKNAPEISLALLFLTAMISKIITQYIASWEAGVALEKNTLCKIHGVVAHLLLYNTK